MQQLKTKTTWRILAAVILLAMLAWFMPANTAEASAATKPKAPRISSKGIVTWDCVYFGHYPQSSDGKGGFKNAPIKWRVLSVKGNDALLFANKNLDARSYNQKNRPITWAQSTIRSWLNGYSSKSNKDGINYSAKNFINRAFTSKQRKAIYKKTIKTEKHPRYGTSGGKNTKDRIFLLSVAEAKKTAYGFPNAYGDTKTRAAKDTAFTNRGQSTYDGHFIVDWWWLLRSPGMEQNGVSLVDLGGRLTTDWGIGDVIPAVRPALHLNLSSGDWKPAGTVSANAKPTKIYTIYAKSKQPKSLTVKWWTGEGTGYRIVAAMDKQFKKGKKTVTVKNNLAENTTIKGLHSGKKYYVKVCAYVKFGKHIIYGPYSNVKSAKVK